MCMHSIYRMHFLNLERGGGVSLYIWVMSYIGILYFMVVKGGMRGVTFYYREPKYNKTAPSNSKGIQKRPKSTCKEGPL